MVVVSKSQLVTLFAVTALALFAPPALAQQGGEYIGAARIIHSLRDSAPRPKIAGLSVRIAALDSAHVRVHIEFMTAGLWSDSGIAARWGDSLIAATTGDFGDTTVWVGVWNGEGYSGRYLVTHGTSKGRYGKWAANLLRGDPLAESEPPPLEFRKSFYESLEKNRRGEVRQLLGLSFDPPAAPVRPASNSSDALADWLGYAILTIVILAYAMEAKRTIPARIAAFRARAPKPNPPGGYAVPCPYCGTERMQIAKKYHVVRGIGVFTRIEEQIIAGCTRCVQRNGTMTCARALFYGPLSLGGLVATPFILCYDLYILFDVARPALVESLIRKAGLDPVLVKEDEYGMTVLQQRRLDTVAYACTMIIWARGERAPRAFELSMQHLRGLCGGVLTDARLAAILNQPRNRMPPPPLDAASRGLVLRLLRTLATADGEPSRAVFAALMVAGQEIGYTEREVNAVVQELMTQVRENAAARAREEAAARAREYAESQARERRERYERDARRRAESNGNGQQRQQSERSQSRPPRRGRDDLDRARSVLGVTASAGFEEIVRAYRSNIAIWHPDRAGLDAAKAQEFTHKAKELTWAMEALRRAMQAQAS